jgi:hypothetical protein
MSNERRSLAKAVGAYLFVVTLLIGAICLALPVVIGDLQVLSEDQPREPTRLEEALETVREIKRRLATPIPPPPPLQPITAKLQRPSIKSAASPQKRVLPRAAADAYAQQPRQDLFSRPAPYVVPDRHTVY